MIFFFSTAREGETFFIENITSFLLSIVIAIRLILHLWKFLSKSDVIFKKNFTLTLNYDLKFYTIDELHFVEDLISFHIYHRANMIKKRRKKNYRIESSNYLFKFACIILILKRSKIKIQKKIDDLFYEIYLFDSTLKWALFEVKREIRNILIESEK